MSYNQRETPILAELCTFLVEDVYGELAARVYSILARHGRQTLAAVARASYLNGRQIKYGLVILLQQHLIFHSGGEPPVTYYEIDWQNSYAVVRFGKVAKLVEDRFGRKAANVMSNLLTLGHTRIADLKEAYFPPDTESDDDSDDGVVNGAGLKRKRAYEAHVNGKATKLNGVVNGVPAELDDVKPDPQSLANGDHATNGTSKAAKANGTAHATVIEEVEDNDEIASVDELYDIIRLLVERGWVRTVSDTQYLSPGDMHDMLQQRAIEEELGGAAMTGTKDKEKVHRKTQQLKRQIRDEWLIPPKFSRKRGDDGSNKRVKINGANYASAHKASSPEDELVVRVNPEKVSVAMRTEQLVQLVEQRLGPVTAYIYQTMLRMLEAHTPRCYEDFPEPPLATGEVVAEITMDPRFLVNARDIAKRLPRDFDVLEGLDPNAVTAVTRKGHVHRSNILSTAIDPSNLSMDEKTQLVDKHIRLLAEDPLHFATWHSRAGFSQWHIEFEEIAKQLIQSEVENTISARKGSLGVKLIRALRKKGKLDERATCNAMMMSAADIRGIVNDLTVQGFVQTQEIPKVERREAKHSLHLVWYDRQRAREKLLHDTYKGMVRIVQRIAFEREKAQPLLSKAERSDVVGNEAKWLSKSELDALQKWKEVQEKLLLQLFREDDLVATLRDFHGPLVSV
ncbi:DNA directed RNA polymeras-like protein III subunit Rpc82 [Ophiobolus disseminans]|uniref:DNA-directed RNA polymerase III subunit RPC3 n=1 Tax=Ophiobolus disseminans TaxID=1469910 RepID=A0A6A6ZZ61_9PLEO|nr:DNA directed RNA polymeras-like protein III subunit Rpc82 [Ophiobolus disseminans]